MSNLSSFIISFCSSCILLGFLYMLCPSGNMRSSVKYVFCLCFVCCILTGIIGMPKADFHAFNSDSDTEIVTEESAAVTAQMIFTQALSDADINFRKIEVKTNKLTDGSITISRVTVYTNESYENITAIIGSDSYEVVIINE